MKTTGVGKVGCPDIVACYRGRFVALEVKREHDGPYGATKKQLHELRMIRAAKGDASIVVTVDDVVTILNMIDFMIDEFDAQS